MSAPRNPEGGIFWVILKLFVSNKIKKNLSDKVEFEQCALKVLLRGI